MKDIFGRKVKAGDQVAVGMSFGRSSSVLRVGEVLWVKEKEKEYRPGLEWSVRVKWTHNGFSGNNHWTVKESTILGDTDYNYAKLIILPRGFVDEFPPDVIEDK